WRRSPCWTDSSSAHSCPRSYSGAWGTWSVMTPEELAQLATAERQATEQYAHRIHVCTATACQAAGSEEIKAALTEEVKSRGLEARCLVKSVGCPGLCAAAPLVSVEPGGVLYQHVAPADAADIAQSVGSAPVARLQARTDIPFFERQQRIVLA